MNNNDMNARIGAYLAELRKRAGLSQEQVAEKLGKSKPAIHYYETGRTEIFADVMIEYCKAVNGDPVQLVLEVTKDE